MREVRAIHFDKMEAARAIIARRTRRGDKLPRGTVDDMLVTPAPGLVCTIGIRDDHGRIRSVEIVEAEVAAALIDHCIATQIPIPRSAKKTVEELDGGVLLVFNLEREIAAGNRPRVLVRRRPAAAVARG